MSMLQAAKDLAPVLIVWAVLYTSDYYLSIWASRLYRSGVDQVIFYPGGIELTPQFREDVAKARGISPRWLISLLLTETILIVLWLLAVPGLEVPLLFDITVTGMILVELAVHSRHLRVLALYLRISQGEGPAGRIEYPHWLSLEQSALEFLAFAVVFALASLLADEISLLGGTLTCGVLAFRHWQWGRRAQPIREGSNSKPHSGSGKKA